MRNLLLFSLVFFLVFQESQQQWVLITNQFTDNQFTDSSAYPWKISDHAGALTTTCGPVNLIGGYGSFGKDVVMMHIFRNLPAHFRIRVSATVYTFGGWENEVFRLFIDGKLSHQSSQRFWSQSAKICDEKDPPAQLNIIDVFVGHSGPEMEIKFDSTLNDNAKTQSWGIRSLSIFAESCDDNCQVISQQFHEQKFYDNSVIDWTSRKPHRTMVSRCADQMLFGGYNIYGAGEVITKVYSKLPIDHYKIYLSFKLYLMDVMDPATIKIIVDGGQAYSIAEFSSQNMRETDVCGWAGKRDEVRDVFIEIPHNSPSIKIQIGDLIPYGSSQESWGLRQLSVMAIKCDNNQVCQTVSREFFDDSFKASEIINWTSKAKPFQKISTCIDKNVVGGYSQLVGGDLTKTFAQLPIDDWDKSKFAVVVDDRVAKRIFLSEDWGGSSHLCNWGDYPQESRTISIVIPHTADFVTVSIRSSLMPGYNQSPWGIRDFTLHAVSCPGCKFLSRQFTDYTGFDYTYWKIKPEENANVSTCGQYQLLGGYKVFDQSTVISRYWMNLPKHDFVYISFTAIFIDAVDSQTFRIKIDDSRVYPITRGARYKGTKNLCGSPNTIEEVGTYTFQIPHSQNTLTFEFSDNLQYGNDQEFWGIRDLIIFYVTYDGNSPTDTSSKDSEFERSGGKAKSATHRQKGSSGDGSGSGSGSGSESSGNNRNGSRNIDQNGESPDDECYDEDGSLRADIGNSQGGSGSGNNSSGTGAKGDGGNNTGGKYQYPNEDGDSASHLQNHGKSKGGSHQGSGSGNHHGNHEGQGNHSGGSGQKSQNGQNNGQRSGSSSQSGSQDDESEYEDDGSGVNSEGQRNSGGSNQGSSNSNNSSRSGSGGGSKGGTHAECVVIYSECGFQGKEFDICDNEPSLPQKGWTHHVKSIFIPEGWKISLFNKENFGGGKYEIDQSVVCIKEMNFSLLSMQVFILPVQRTMLDAKITETDSTQFDTEE